ncbi:hypothetical protein [Glycomyces paridis]|uniref:Uncharacterized protein n=1 Tax=Glycomyces paridis TaxID=2126555 RepID=A0A4S8NXK5_9ACTN|nr:hypothetical protein [Glycomyces paridis]THV21671.1 hypothetical protein E9998_24625 [Glycomyces paridis]
MTDRTDDDPIEQGDVPEPGGKRPGNHAENESEPEGTQADPTEDERDLEPLKEFILEEVGRRLSASAGGSLQVILGRDFLNSTIGNGAVTSGAGAQSIALGFEIPGARIEAVKHTYLPPVCYFDLQSRLDEHRLLILRARRGWGGTVTAVRLLCDDHERIQQISEVDGRLSALRLDELERGSGLIVENLGPEQLRELASGQAERLSAKLKQLEARAVVVVDESSLRPDHRMERFVADLAAHPDPRRLVESHLAERLGSEESARELLSADTLAAWFAAAPVGDGFDAHLLVGLAHDLAEGVQAGGGVEEALERFAERSESDTDNWFDGIANHGTPSVTALALTVAVLEGLPYGTVSRVAGALERILAGDLPAEGRERNEPRRVRRTQVLKTVRAKLTTERRNGRLQNEDEVISFQDDRYRRHVLDLVYEYGFENEILPWLRELTVDREVAVAVCAAEVVGHLGKFDFRRIQTEFIGPWARSPRPYDRELAVIALAVLAREARTLHAVTRLVGDWSRKKLGPLRRTAARALGAGIGPLMPAGPDDLLDRLAEGADRPLAKAIGSSIAELFALADTRRRIVLLDMLCEWSEESTAWNGFAGIAGFVECGRIRLTLSFNGERVRWPLLLVLSSFDGTFDREQAGGWDQEATGRIRDLTAALIASAAADSALLPEFERMLKGWASDAEQHPMLAREIDELLAEAAESPGGGRNVEYYRRNLLDGLQIDAES